jgi:hypothetical protein
MSYHGVVYVDIQPLLYPGATHIRGAYKICPFVENEYTTKVRFVNVNYEKYMIQIQYIIYFNIYNRQNAKQELLTKH